jgi:syntaxin-binding protein 1
LDFLATESILFHLDQPEALEKVYGSLPDPAYAGVVGKRLVNLCISLNEHPCIRYQGNSAFAREVATALHQGLLQFKRTNSAFWCYGDDRHNEKDRGQFLILDRSFDPLSPLIHDFTYQAMAYDLLDISEGVYNYNVTTGKGSEERVALLNESDEFWVEHRYSHIAKVVDAVRERMLDIVQNEPAAQIAKKNATDVDISSLSAVVKQLPQYNQMMTKISQHVELSQKCMKEVNGQNLINVSQIESTISTGSDEDGSEVKGQKLLAQVVELFKLIDSSRISTKKELKTRVLAIYYVSQRGIPGSDEFIRQAVQAANLGNDEKQLITNFERILAAAQITAAADEKGKQGGIFSAIFGGAKVIKHAATAEGEYIESRHVPLIKLHLEQLMNGNLPLDKFPAMGPSVAPVQKSEAKSVRRFGAASRFGKKENVQFTGGRFMVFVTGGATFNEARYAYELMNKEQKEVIFGSTHIMTPSAYLTDVGSLHRPPASQSRVATTHDRKEANL